MALYYPPPPPPPRPPQATTTSTTSRSLSSSTVSVVVQNDHRVECLARKFIFLSFLLLLLSASSSSPVSCFLLLSLLATTMSVCLSECILYIHMKWRSPSASGRTILPPSSRVFTHNGRIKRRTTLYGNDKYKPEAWKRHIRICSWF